MPSRQMAEEAKKTRRIWAWLLVLLGLGGYIYVMVLEYEARANLQHMEEDVDEGDDEANERQYNPFANCGCEKNWDPVCADIPQDECEAQCQLIEKYTPGICKDQNPMHVARNKCMWEECPPVTAQTYKPVCWYGEERLMKCHVECLVKHEYPSITLKPGDIQDGPCSDPCESDPCFETGRECWGTFGKCFEEPCQPYACIVKDCECDLNEWAPVCSKGQTFTNLCFANCEDMHHTAVPGECEKKDPYHPYVHPRGREEFHQEL